MGVVYEVVHTRLQQRCAIKMLLPRVQVMPDVVARFEREARAACRLKSRYAVRILDVDHATIRGTERAYMVMEFLDGHDLAQELHGRGRLPVGEAVDVVLQACAAMAEAHASGVVHRDLKPSNLLLVREGTRRIVKVLDFGISKVASDVESAVTSTFATMGTPLYMSPEQIRSTKNVDGRTDIWSLGVILYESLAGIRPFQGTTTAAAAAIVADEPPPIRELVPEVNEALEAALARALAKKAEDRFPDVRAFAVAIAPFASEPALLDEVAEAAAVKTSPSAAARESRRPATPSFVHATTVAQPTPMTRRSVSPKAASIEEHARSASEPRATPPPGAPSTEAAWSGNEPTTRSRATRVGGAVALVAVMGAMAGVWFARGRGGGPSAPAAVGIVQSVTATEPAPASASASAPAFASASASAPTPTKHHPAKPPSPSSAAPSPPAAAPAATNPVHL